MLIHGGSPVCSGGFGFGWSCPEDSLTRSYGGGGGGGWFGGGSMWSYAGAGGSGFVYTETNSQYTNSSYTGGEWLLNSSYFLMDDSYTVGGNTSFLAPNGETELGHSGNGYARITAVD